MRLKIGREDQNKNNIRTSDAHEVENKNLQ